MTDPGAEPVEVPSLFDTSVARLALLSTYQFDPDYFEHVLLRKPALAAARRIAVFIDARAYFDLVRSGAPARHINRRYLMVPVDRSPYVFHPKLSLLLGEEVGRVVCGSHNLTRAGCAGNLELTSCVPFDSRVGGGDRVGVARAAFRFFRSAAGQVESGSGSIVSGWLDDATDEWPWLTNAAEPDGDDIRLVQSYDAPLWNVLVDEMRQASPERIHVVSPFYDGDAGLLRRLMSAFPTAEVELVVQQNVTTLPRAALVGLTDRVRLSELVLSAGARRLHAKLVLWAGADTGALVGSANLTVAAFDGGNAEACFLLRGIDLARVFGQGVDRRPLPFEDFIPGEEDPEPDERDGFLLHVESVVLSGRLLRATHARVPTAVGNIRIELRGPGDLKPSVVRSLKRLDERTAVAELPDGAAIGHGPLLAQVVASIDGVEHATPPIWVIDESLLTHESDGADGRSRQQRVERTGEGLVELLDELGERNGAAAVADCLRRILIRFDDGVQGVAFGRRFRVVMRDPFHADRVPEWLLAGGGADPVPSAVLDFADRHERHRLRRHAERGNVNGMANFLDILRACVRVLYIYYRRGQTMAAAQMASRPVPVVKRGEVIDRLSDYIDLATAGWTYEDGTEENGYLFAVAENLEGDPDLLRQACKETNFAGELRAVLLILQHVRFRADEAVRPGRGPKRPRDCFPEARQLVADTLSYVEVNEPDENLIASALAAYRIFSDEEIRALLKEL